MQNVEVQHWYVEFSMAVKYPRGDVLLSAAGKMNSELRREVWANNISGGLEMARPLTREWVVGGAEEQQPPAGAEAGRPEAQTETAQIPGAAPEAE